MKSCSGPLLAVFMGAAFAGSASAEFKSTGVPRYDAAVRNAVKFINGDAANIVERETSLVAYALLKAGEPVTSPLVKKGIEGAIERTEAGHGGLGYDHIYLAGVDAMLLADTDPEAHAHYLQKIASYVESAQRPDGSWNGDSGAAGDASMNQYGMLALWAALRAKCSVSPQVVDRCAQWHLKFGDSDGGWGYRPPSSSGSGGGRSTHNCTMAGAGSLGIARELLFGPKTRTVKTEEVVKKFGILDEAKPEPKEESRKAAFDSYNAKVSASGLDSRIQRAFQWTTTRFHPEGHALNQKQYFFYALERAAALYELKQVEGKDWYNAYADVLLALQSEDGSFEKTNQTPRIATSFAILYLMRSTKQILDKQYSGGVMMGGRDASELFGDKKKKKDIGPLDELLAAMENADLDSLDINADDLVEKIQFGSKEDLIGQIDLLKKLLKHPDATNRQAAFFALGRTGDFSLIPQMLQGLRDPNVGVNSEALQALRYISRKPTGFDLPVNPLDGPKTASEAQKLVRANDWRTKAYRTWHTWYASVRPYQELDGLDALELLAPSGGRR